MLPGEILSICMFATLVMLLFSGFPVAFAIGVSAQLQPASQLAVVGEQYARTIRADQPGAGGEVAF